MAGPISRSISLRHSQLCQTFHCHHRFHQCRQPLLPRRDPLQPACMHHQIQPSPSWPCHPFQSLLNSQARHPPPHTSKSVRSNPQHLLMAFIQRGHRILRAAFNPRRVPPTQPHGLLLLVHPRHLLTTTSFLSHPIPPPSRRIQGLGDLPLAQAQILTR